MGKDQRVRITIKEKFCVSLLHKYLEKEEGGLNLDEINKDLLQIIVGKHGQQVIGHVTSDGAIAVSRETISGTEGYVMVGTEFIEMDNIEPLGSPYFKGKMYRIAGDNDTLGVFVKMEFDGDNMEPIYTIVTSAKEFIRGNTMVEMNDEELDLFGYGLRKEYYAKA